MHWACTEQAEASASVMVNAGMLAARHSASTAPPRRARFMSRSPPSVTVLESNDVVFVVAPVHDLDHRTADPAHVEQTMRCSSGDVVGASDFEAELLLTNPGSEPA